MSRQAAIYAFALFSTLAVAEPSEPTDECPKQASSEVVVQAFRFSDGRSYAYRVTNNGTRPIVDVIVGRGGDEFIEIGYNTKPVSMGSPNGWQGEHTAGQDPRLPGSHSHTLISYWWRAEDWETGGIQPGQSLSGFSVQLPTPQEAELAYMQFRASMGWPQTSLKDPPFEERLPPQPDLTDVPFEVGRRARCNLVGTVELDRGWSASDTPGREE